MKLSVKISIISTLVCAAEMYFLVKIFPQTGLSRILSIPCNISLNLILTLILVRSMTGKSNRVIIIGFILMQILLFHLYLWVWPPLREEQVFDSEAGPRL